MVVKNDDIAFNSRNGPENEESVAGSVKRIRDNSVAFDKIGMNVDYHHSNYPASSSLVSIW